MRSLELNDIQGIIVRGYGAYRAAAYVLLSIRERAAARQWLSEIVESVMDGVQRPSEPCINIAFTHEGLRALGLHEAALNTFRLEFQEGMTATAHRRRILGDVGESAPENWGWGGPNGSPVHVLLLLYAPDDEALAAFYASHRLRFEQGGLALVQYLDTVALKGRKEHFGFRDGIAQPLIAGYKSGPTGNTIRPGEFLFGYPDEYGAYPPTPTVEMAHDPGGILPELPDDTGQRDLGRNGSYLVFRQLSQDVYGFWRFMEEKTRRDGVSESGARIRLASKMVGRWPGGAPLVVSPDKDDPTLQNEDDFLYHATDKYGDKCPIGAHIRRSNPRDSLEPDPGSETSLNVGKRHRIIRRGRAYGDPAAPSMEPDDILGAGAEDTPRGLHFICFNTNINRQFEFIQHTWANNPKFGGQYQDADPLIGEHDPHGTGATGVFTMPAEPVRLRVTGLPRFVHVRGGAYFFMPGKTALRYLASMPSSMRDSSDGEHTP